MCTCIIYHHFADNVVCFDSAMYVLCSVVLPLYNALK